MVMDVGQLRASATLDISDASKNLDDLKSRIDDFHKSHGTINLKSGGGGGGSGGGGGGGGEGGGGDFGKAQIDAMSSSIRYGSTLAAQFGAQGSELTQVLRSLAASGDLAGAGIGAIGIAATVGLASIVKLGDAVNETEARFTVFTGTSGSKVIGQLDDVAKYGVSAEDALKSLGKVAPEIELAPGGQGFSQGKDTIYGTYKDLTTSAAQTALTLGEPFNVVEQNVADLAIAFKESFSQIDDIVQQTAISTGQTTSEISGSMERIKRVLGPATPEPGVLANLQIAANEAGLPTGRQSTTTQENLIEGLSNVNNPQMMDVLAQMGISMRNPDGSLNNQILQQFAPKWRAGQLPPGMSQEQVASIIDQSDPYGAENLLGQQATGQAIVPDQSKIAANILASTPGQERVGLGTKMWDWVSGKAGGLSNNIQSAFTGESYDPRIAELAKLPNMSREDMAALQRIQQTGGEFNGNPQDWGRDVTAVSDSGPVGPTLGSLRSKYIDKNGKPIPQPGVDAAGVTTDPTRIYNPDQAAQANLLKGQGMTPLQAELQSRAAPGDKTSQVDFLGEGVTRAGTAAASATQGSQALADAQKQLAVAFMTGDQTGEKLAQTAISVAQSELQARDATVSLATAQGQAAASVPGIGTSQLQSQNAFAASSPKMQSLTGGSEQGIEAANTALAAAKAAEASSGGSGQAFQSAKAAEADATNQLTFYTSQLGETKEAAIGLGTALQQAFTQPTVETLGMNVKNAAAELKVAQIMAPHLANGTPLSSGEAQEVGGLKGQEVLNRQANIVPEKQQALNVARTAQYVGQQGGAMTVDQQTAATQRLLSGGFPSQTTSPISGPPPVQGAVQATFNGTLNFNVDGVDIKTLYDSTMANALGANNSQLSNPQGG